MKPGQLFICLIAVMISTAAFAQNTRWGIVSDANGHPLDGVNVTSEFGFILGTTNFEGHYEIEAIQDASIGYHLAGFQSAQRVVAESNIMDVDLVPQTQTKSLIIRGESAILNGFKVPVVESPGQIQGAGQLNSPHSLATVFPLHLFLTASEVDPVTFNAPPLLQTIDYNNSVFAFSTWPSGVIIAVDLADQNLYATGAGFGSDITAFGPLVEVYQQLELPDVVLAQGDQQTEVPFPVIQVDLPHAYRASRITPKPAVSGVQTAIVEKESTGVTDESESLRYRETIIFDDITETVDWTELSKYLRNIAGRRFLVEIEKEVEVRIDGIVVEQYTETITPERPILRQPGEMLRSNQIYFTGGVNFNVVRDFTFPQVTQELDSFYESPKISIITAVDKEINYGGELFNVYEKVDFLPHGIDTTIINMTTGFPIRIVSYELDIDNADDFFLVEDGFIPTFIETFSADAFPR